MTSKRQSVVSSILWLTIAEVIFNFSGYIIHAFLGRMLGPADYGRYAIVVTLTTVVIMLIGNGIPTAMSKYISAVFESNPGAVLTIKRQALWLQMGIISFITIIFYVLAPITANLLNDPSLTPLLQISAFIIPLFAAASFYLFYYIGLHQFSIQAKLKIVRAIARIGFVIGLAYFFGIKGSIVAYILAPATVFATAWIIDYFWINRDFIRIPRHHFNWKKLLKYAWPVTLFMLFYEILISLDLYFVKSLLDDDTLAGIYNAAITVGRIPYYLFYALTMVILPSISRTTEQKNFQETTRIIAQSFRMMIIILIPMMILLIVYAGPLIQLLFGAKYIDATTTMKILAPGAILLTVFYVMSSALNGAGKVRLPMWIALAGVIINAILNYFFIIRWGITGAAIATTVTSAVITTAILVVIHKNFQGLMKPRSFLMFALAGLITWLISFFFPPNKWLFILWSILLSGLYLGLLTIFGEFTRKDIDLFRRMLFARNKKATPPLQEDAS